MGRCSQLPRKKIKRNEFGEYGPHPIEQEEFVDERRKEVGLNTLAEYKDQHSKQTQKNKK